MPRLAVTLIVVAEFLGTSLWFSANAAADDLQRAWGLDAADLGTLTSAVQLGFITGTLVFALSGLADRFPASRIFAVCAVAGAAANAGFALAADGLADAWAWRFATGVALAGVYPVGMKLVVSWAPRALGRGARLAGRHADARHRAAARRARRGRQAGRGTSWCSRPRRSRSWRPRWCCAWVMVPISSRPAAATRAGAG